MDSTTTEDIINKNKMSALLNGVTKGKNNYEDDLDELAQGLKNASSGSKIADTLYERLMPSLNDNSISNDFEKVIGQIKKHT